jgi:hypothetical protein
MKKVIGIVMVVLGVLAAGSGVLLLASASKAKSDPEQTITIGERTIQKYDQRTIRKFSTGGKIALPAGLVVLIAGIVVIAMPTGRKP